MSHTWGDEEVTLQDVQTGRAEGNRGFDKVKNCCAYAKDTGNFDYVWIDTCCIDKTSSAKLSEAINSMYRWYNEAEICYAFLADALSEREIAGCRWFTRGWTLQELIAPSKLIFLNKNWKELGSRADLAESIFQWTGISVGVLTGKVNIETVSVAQRMSWASSRNTRRLEDRAYSLMGLFGINMPLIYGEGRRAFTRLQEEIMRISDDYSIFAWRTEDEDEDHGGLLATSPRAFEHSADILPSQQDVTPSFGLHSNAPLTVSSRGIHLTVPFLPIGYDGLGLAILNCARQNKSNLTIAVYVKDVALTLTNFERVWCHKLEEIDLSAYRPAQHPLTSIIVRQPRLLRRRDHLAGHSGPRQDVRKFAGSPEDQYQIESSPQTTMELPPTICLKAREGDMEGLRAVVTASNADGLDKTGRTPLSHAAEAGHANAAWFLLMRRTVNPDRKDDRERTPLSYAAENGHSSVVWLLLMRSDVLMHSADADGLTPLSYAARGGHHLVLNMLLGQARTRQELYDDNRRTPLSYASEYGHSDMVQALLTRGYIEPDAADNHGKTPLYWAIFSRRHDVIALLREKGANVEATFRDENGKSDPECGRMLLWRAVECRDSHIVDILLHFGLGTELPSRAGITMLVSAAENDDCELARILLSHRANMSARGKTGNTPLLIAAKRSNTAFVKLLLEHDAGLEVSNLDRFAALNVAVPEGFLDIARLLLESGSDVEARSSGRPTPLAVAINNRNCDMARLLLQYKADRERRDLSNRTPLHSAIYLGDSAMVALLLEHGADAEAEETGGWGGPLLLATRCRNIDIVRLLLEHRVRTEAGNRVNQTALSLAAKYGECGIISLLLDFGADIEVKNTMAQTPLFCAAQEGKVKAVELLLSRGANVDVEDDQGQSPLMVAVKSRDLATQELLKRAIQPKQGDGRPLVDRFKNKFGLSKS